MRRERGIPILVEAERLRPCLNRLLELADYVVTSAHFPQAALTRHPAHTPCYQTNAPDDGVQVHGCCKCAPTRQRESVEGGAVLLLEARPGPGRRAWGTPCCPPCAACHARAGS